MGSNVLGSLHRAGVAMLDYYTTPFEALERCLGPSRLGYIDWQNC
jgi:hypothetical protein